MFGYDCFDQFATDFNQRSKCQIVFGGDCFDQFATDFNDNSSKSVTI